MEHNGKYKGPTEENNSEIVINDLDTLSRIIEKPSDGPKDSKPDNGTDSIIPSSGDVIKHSVNKNDDSSNTDCGKRNIDDCDVPTVITENDEIANARKIAAFVRKVLHNEVPDEKMEWPLCLLIESNRTVKISQQELQNMILNKAAEVMATHGKSHIAKQMVNISVCKEQQRLYYKKYKQLLNYVNTVTSELELLNRVPDDEVKHVRNVGTYVVMPTKKKKL
ncbi:uncharacterized protein LOC100163293 [Acyrthosiphon pisum]|uniref:ACYPI004387 protein n=1 Tax=Acyrthosiphon pisum TaxID=7029 RepID=C4WV74_ACYPI|nr:uncharacterized protein LOC100163293 [Acyrthosiphon pisum]BAH71794.1 ACYPI004387 [Acyrthosiphon pisum]|eukprot:NP_001156160.1 uncharacterized protein LOC100163293 [Acyrthosiphon pisum]